MSDFTAIINIAFLLFAFVWLFRCARDNKRAEALVAENATLRADNERLATQVRLAGVSAEVTVHQEVGRAITETLAVTIERDRLAGEVQRITEARRVEWANAQQDKAELKALRDEKHRAGYWKQRARSAEGHLFAGDIKAAMQALHKRTSMVDTPWDELSCTQRAQLSSGVLAVIGAVNAQREWRLPNDHYSATHNGYIETPALTITIDQPSVRTPEEAAASAAASRRALFNSGGRP